MKWLAVALGGALGSVARHGVNIATARMLGEAGPWSTATVNIVGSLAIGILAGAFAAERLSMSLPARTFLLVGILGGFTTFSSFMLDSFTLMHTGAPLRAAHNLIGQLLIGVVVTYLGYNAGLKF